MSATDKVFSALKAILLMQERFDSVDKKLQRQETDLIDLSRSHAGLAQRVARIEGMIEGASRASGRQPRLPRA